MFSQIIMKEFQVNRKDHFVLRTDYWKPFRKQSDMMWPEKTMPEIVYLD